MSESDRPLRIRMVVGTYPPSHVGGLERQAHLLSKQLREDGHDVVVMTLDGNGRFRQEEVFDAVPVIRFPRPRLLGHAGAFGVAALLSELGAQRHSVDVCHVHNISRLSAALAVTCSVAGIPTLVKVPNVGQNGIAGARERWGPLWWKLFRTHDAAVAMSAGSIRELTDGGFPKSRIFPTSNGVRVPERPAVRNNHHDIVLFAGRVEPKKGVEPLLRAWASLSSDLRDRWRLRLVGKIMRPGLVEAVASELGIRVECPGYCTDMDEEYARADLLVLPSMAEGNSNAILEAMAAGLPVVATSVGGTPMLLGDAGRDSLVEPGDTVGLTRSLERLLGNDQLRHTLGRKLYERAASNFSINVVAQRYVDCYRALVARRREIVYTLGSPLVAAAH